MKRVIAMILTVCIAFSLAACGGSAGSSAGSSAASGNTGSSASAGSAGSDTLVVDIWDNNQLDGLQQIADEWTKTSGIKVQINVITWTEYWTLLEAGASGGEMPDVFWMHINEAQKYMRADKLLNLNDYIEKDDAIDLSNYYEGIVNIYNLDGNQFALPKDHDTIALLYNKKIFDKYGVEYPNDNWTWDDYAKAAAEITEKGKADGVYGTAMNTNDGQDGWYNLIYGWGGKLISDDNTKSGMDDPKTIEAMTWLADNLFPSMPEQNLMADTDPDVMFMSGIVGMMLQGSWMVNTFYTAENAADYAWAQIPYHDTNGNGQCDEGERVSLYNGLGWAASAETKNPDAAYSLISAFCSEEGQKKQAELGVTMAAYKGCSDAFVSAFEGMDIAPFLTVEEDGTLIQHPASRYTTAWEGGFTTGLVPAWQHPETMADVCKEMAQMMNDVLATE
ncbi:MAG: sugar ABC transporter substrate-binding protein [Lachnospiraceae bacterium]|nr:sugar ABC transporter substrate-binding protein [Lachnospiraceae bacterium]